MELRHLRYFVAVAEEQNVTRAAARLHISQPPLSRQIGDLEEYVGVPLLKRGAKSVRLTEAGRLFLEEARAVLNRADEAVQAVRLLATGSLGNLHVGYAPSLTVQILPAALREFERLSPGTKVTLHDLSTGEMIERLREEKLHVALTIRTRSASLTGLTFRELRRHAACVATPSSHAFVTGRPPTLKQIFAERLITYTQSDYPEYTAWLKNISPVPLCVAEEHDSSSSLVAAIEAGRGIALVPESFSCFAGMRLTVRPVGGKITPFIVGAVTTSKPPLIAAKFVEAAVTTAAS